MKINRNNYEFFFLDYHEGNLGDGLKKELFAFLEANPDLEEEFDRFEMVAVEAPNKRFVNKDVLRKNTITVYNYKTWFIRFIENDLNDVEKNEVELFLKKNRWAKPELEIFKRTTLVPDQQIIFENKQSLKHGGKVIVLTPQWMRVAVAAAIALLVMAYFYFRNTKQEMVAQHETVQPAVREQKMQPENNSPVHPDALPGMKKETAEKNIQKKKRFEPANHLAPHEIAPNKSNEELTQQETAKTPAPVISPLAEKKDSANILLTGNPVEQKKTFRPVTRLSDVFSDDELKELGVKPNTSPDQKAGLWDIASKGAKEIGKATHTNIELNRQHNEADNSISFAFVIGNFSVSHTSVK